MNRSDELAKQSASRKSEGVSGNDGPSVFLPDSSSAFLSSPPAWTVNGALLQTPDGRAARVTQRPFTWVDGAWDTTVTILPVEASTDARTLEVRVRITPDTLRRWSDVGINPFLEACAQLEEYWRTAKSTDFARLTWL